MWPICVTPDRPGRAITNLDVIKSIYVAFRTPVNKSEWKALGHNSKAQRRINRAYRKRCTQTGEWTEGLRRSDFLLGHTTLAGVETKADGNHEIVFMR